MTQSRNPPDDHEHDVDDLQAEAMADVLAAEQAYADHLAAYTASGATPAETAAYWQALRDRQAAWQQKQAALWARGGEVATLLEESTLAAEVAAIRTCQALSLGTLSPVAIARLWHELGRIEIAGIDGVESLPYYTYVAIQTGVEGIWQQHAQWVFAQQQERQRDAQRDAPPEE